MLCGVAVVALMEVTIAKRKKGQPSHGMMWTTIVLIIITMVIGANNAISLKSKHFSYRTLR